MATENNLTTELAIDKLLELEAIAELLKKGQDSSKTNAARKGKSWKEFLLPPTPEKCKHFADS